MAAKWSIVVSLFVAFAVCESVMRSEASAVGT